MEARELHHLPARLFRSWSGLGVAEARELRRQLAEAFRSPRVENVGD